MKMFTKPVRLLKHLIKGIFFIYQNTVLTQIILDLEDVLWITLERVVP